MIFLLTVAFALGVSFLKLGQHFSLQTQAYDLGVFANVLWNTSQGRFFENSMSGVNHLGDHFSPLLVFLVPLFWVWKNAAVLLLAQSFALAAAIPAVYSLANHRLRDGRAALLFSLWFAFFPYLHKVSRFDFHETALGIPLLLWAFYFWETKRLRWFWGFAAATLLLREDYSLLLAGFGALAAASGFYKKEKQAARQGLWLTGLCAAVFLLDVLVLIPHFGRSWRAAGWSYGNLGGSFPEMVRSLLSPAALWRNSLGQPEKLKSVLKLAAFSGGLWLAAPREMLLLLIPLGLNLLSGRPWQFGLDLHYSATVLPFLFYAMIQGYENLKRVFAYKFARPLFFGSMLLLSLIFLPRYFYPVPLARTRTAWEIFRSIPSEDSLQTQNNLAPHLCLRERIALFPDSAPAQWVLLDRRHTGWFFPPDVDGEMDAFQKINAGRLVLEKDGFFLYRFP